jgi:hypothetical protein
MEMMKRGEKKTRKGEVEEKAARAYLLLICPFPSLVRYSRSCINSAGRVFKMILRSSQGDQFSM